MAFKYIMGWILMQNGICTPNLKFPFTTHHSRYMENIPRINVARKLILNFSRLSSKEFRNGWIGNP